MLRPIVNSEFWRYHSFPGYARERILQFNSGTDSRDWDQFHSPKNLSMALSAEVAEITGYFQWLTEEHIKEIADVISNDGVWFAVGEK